MKRLLKYALTLILALVFSNNYAYSQIVSDSPSYIGATIYYPQELNANIQTSAATYALFERSYTNHMGNMTLDVTVMTERSFDDDMILWLSTQYVNTSQDLADTGRNITYKTFNQKNKFFVISWSYRGQGYYFRSQLRGNTVYMWTLCWDMTDKEVHKRAQSYLNNRYIYYKW